ncbi:MAG: GNAT family N-acetyltransferase [Candidatus Magasanikbacteria bacterium]|nr:GNAT family N-acetyltransferase [Candidatus Magasanikbacteria bacterium]
MRVRLARDEDYVAIARLHRQTIRNVNSKDYTEDQVYAWSARTNTERFRSSADKCKRWVAVEDDKIVGFCDHGFNCELWGLYIHKEHIGKGIGSRLLKVAEDSLKKHGCKRVTLKGTVTAKEFYKKQGYKIIKKDFHPVNDKKLEIFVMVKKLS